jgi:cell wall-associated NlpC family hydrolase
MRDSRLAGGLAALAVLLVLLTAAPAALATGIPKANPGVAKIATRLMGIPYVSGGTTTSGVDAPGLAKLAYRKAGMWLPGTIRRQAAHGVKITREQLRAGDLVFGSAYEDVGIYAGGDAMIEAPGPGSVVRYATIDWSSGVHLRRYNSRTGYHAAFIASRCLGAPYVFGGASPSGFDASGLTMYVYAKLGVKLEHGATWQQKNSRPVPLSKLRRGDLVFLGSASYSPHVGIYMGNGRMIDAPHAGSVVQFSTIKGAWIGGRCLPVR